MHSSLVDYDHKFAAAPPEIFASRPGESRDFQERHAVDRGMQRRGQNRRIAAPSEPAGEAIIVCLMMWPGRASWPFQWRLRLLDEPLRLLDEPWSLK
jgi:hypothetical protein